MHPINKRLNTNNQRNLKAEGQGVKVLRENSAKDRNDSHMEQY